MSEQHLSSNTGDNTYILDAESAIEMARLLDQDKIMTQNMGGIFGEREDTDLLGVSAILDIACGPGGWVLDVARTYPHIEVTGIDISKNAISYARAQTQLLKLQNAHFEVMDALKPLTFPDESFDVVNMRTVIGFVLPQLWPQFLEECRRLLRPGGIIRITEAEWGFSNKAAFELLMLKTSQALQRLNRSFSPNGINIGITPVLRPLLQQANFEQVKMKAYVADGSYGTGGYEAAFQDLKLLFELSRPLWLHTKVMTEQEIETLSTQALAEMQEEDFYALSYLLTVWGVKPEKA
ncbi:MAG TPA: class I SAM-dependent methyltransferase [Ktedonobacter sp.]|nr:class I SAM-dependent methyltransferase [Ktedonobacter sp.]